MKIDFLSVMVLVSVLFSACQTEREKTLQRISKDAYQELMVSDYQSFDQTPQAGWRKYGQDPELQIQLIRDYIRVNNAKEQSLRWHLGQLLARVGDYEEAKVHFEQCIYQSDPLGPVQKAWNYYVKGTMAFLDQDEAGLNAYIDSLQNNDETMNLNILLKFKENFGKTYQEAY